MEKPQGGGQIDPLPPAFLVHVEFSGVLKHVDSQLSQNVFIGESSMHELKSPSKIKLSYLDDSESVL